MRILYNSKESEECIGFTNLLSLMNFETLFL